MKGLRYLLLLPVILLLASITAGISSYQDTKEEMRRDLTRALRQFVMDQPQQQLLLDTLSSLQSARVLTLRDVEERFRNQLTILPLRDTSHVALCLMQEDGKDLFSESAQVCSDTLLWASPAEHDKAVIALKAFANPSVCSIITHSDQRLSLTGFLLCLLMLWGMARKARTMNRAMETAVILPSPQTSKEIHLTPMQQQLMDLFANAPGHVLSKEAICAALWPKKDRPENTLYTFISRLKTTLKDQTDLDIINRRGKEYQLVDQSEASDNQHIQ